MNYKNHHIITESPLIDAPSKLKVIDDGPWGKVRFTAIIQTVGDINKNGRLYEKNVLKKGLDKIQDRIKMRSCVGELDHPLSQDPARQCQVLYQYTSHVILDTHWDGNNLLAEMETTSTSKGYDLYGLIAKDFLVVGFSLRALGDLEPAYKNGKKYNKVTGDLSIICWDCVSNPSHAKATLIKINESTNRQILESINPSNIVSQTKNMICTVDSNGKSYCFVPNAFDILVENSKKNIMNKFLLG